MTKDERALAKGLSEYITVELHKHINLDGKKRWKVKTQDGKPLMCITNTLFNRMEQRIGLIRGENSFMTLDCVQLKANLFDWETRKHNRSNKKKLTTLNQFKTK